MTDIPIIFSAPMVRALLAGRKTMTRRLAWRAGPGIAMAKDGSHRVTGKSPWQKVKPGDRLWVRENFATPFRRTETSTGCIYRADGAPFNLPSDRNFHTWDDSQKWTPSIHMPRWASRLTLVVTATKIERLQDISEEDAVAEGCYKHETGKWWTSSDEPKLAGILAGDSARGAFYCLWKHLHGADCWADNPEVVALTFKVHRCNIDTMGCQA